MSDVRIETIPLLHGHQFGRILLQREKALNALSLPMLQNIHQALVSWQADPNLKFVMIRSSSPRALCAGGDIKALWARPDESPAQRAEAARHYFRTEYTVDHLVHTYRKPIVALLDGHVLGGGWGLIAGASHICATPHVQLAMPEISIGLFPDVGASWFLNRLPLGITLWAGLTGHRWTAREAQQAGFVHHILSRSALQDVELELARQTWTSQSIAQQLHQLLSTHKPDSAALCAENPSIWEALAPLQMLTNHSASLQDWWRLLQINHQLQDDFAEDISRLSQGSALSAHVIYQQLRRLRRASLAHCFAWDIHLTEQFIKDSDFAEGVRALLIDKDSLPQWKYPDIFSVPAAAVRRFFKPRSPLFAK